MGAPEVSPALKAKIRSTFNGQYILSGGYDAARAEADLDAQRGDRWLWSPVYLEPDLVTKLQTGQPLAEPDFATYTPGEQGYTDY
jgi:N-ethylmaleimide reductase